MSARELAYCGILGAAALLLPVMFHLVPLGMLFMPMYLPLALLPFFVRPGAAVATALLVPLLSGAATGMPPFYPPVGPIMSLELAALVLTVGVLRMLNTRLPSWIMLLAGLSIARLLGVLLYYAAAHCLSLPPTFVASITFLTGWPGMILMLVVIPPVVRARR